MSDEVTAEQENETTVMQESGENSGVGIDEFLKRDAQFHTGKSKAPETKESAPVKPVTPPKEEAAQKQEKTPESSKKGTPEKEPETEEKRLKDKDRYITKLEEERKELKLTVAKMNKLINKYGSDAVVYDENGDPVGFNFETKKETTKKTAEESDPEPPEPTEDDDIKTFNQKVKDRVKWELRQEARQKEEAKAKEQEAKEKAEQEKLREQVFKEAVNEDYDGVVELFPDAKNKESELFKKATEIYLADKKRLSLRSDRNSYCFFRAADALGLKPVTTKEETPKREIKIVKKPNFADLGGGGSGDFPNPVQNKLDWFNQREKQFVKK